MKANYNREIEVREKSVAFRTKKAIFCIIQNTLYDRMGNDEDVVYLDFENEEQIDRLINTLQELKNRTYKKDEENADDGKTES